MLHHAKLGQDVTVLHRSLEEVGERVVADMSAKWKRTPTGCLMRCCVEVEGSRKALKTIKGCCYGRAKECQGTTGRNS